MRKKTSKKNRKFSSRINIYNTERWERIGGKPGLNSGKICEKGFTKGEEVCRMSQVGRRKGLTGDGKPE